MLLVKLVHYFKESFVFHDKGRIFGKKHDAVFGSFGLSNRHTGERINDVCKNLAAFNRVKGFDVRNVKTGGC